MIGPLVELRRLNYAQESDAEDSESRELGRDIRGNDPKAERSEKWPVLLCTDEAVHCGESAGPQAWLNRQERQSGPQFKKRTILAGVMGFPGQRIPI